MTNRVFFPILFLFVEKLLQDAETGLPKRQGGKGRDVLHKAGIQRSLHAGKLERRPVSEGGEDRVRCLQKREGADVAPEDQEDVPKLVQTNAVVPFFGHAKVW